MLTAELNVGVVRAITQVCYYSSDILAFACIFSSQKYGTLVVLQVADKAAGSDCDSGLKHEKEQLLQSHAEFSEPPQPDQKSQTGFSDFSDEFVPGTMCK